MELPSVDVWTSSRTKAAPWGQRREELTPRHRPSFGPSSLRPSCLLATTYRCPSPRSALLDPGHDGGPPRSTHISISTLLALSLRSVGGVPPRPRLRVVTMSIRRMSLGAGYRYLMSSVARLDGGAAAVSGLTRYYAESGTPPGRFLGRGLAGLANGAGLAAGSTVTEEHLWRMLGMLQDPLTGEQLGRPPIARREWIDCHGRTKNAALPVAGFDLTFSAPKSVSVAWALAGPATREAIHTAHLQALEFIIAHAESNVFASRSGPGGIVQEDIRGIVAAAFDHWDSRAGDPQLHTHVVVMNRAQTADGLWRTLDSRALFKEAVGLSELYNGVLSDLLTSTLGWGWDPARRRHSPVPKWEVAGVPERLQAEFSQRTSAIEESTKALVAGFVASHGRQPVAREIIQMRQQATLETRPDKHLRPLGEMVADWRRRATPVIGEDQVGWVAGLAGRNDLPLLTSADLTDAMCQDVARLTVEAVSGSRATFTRSNVFAEAVRQVHGVRFARPAERVRVVERVIDLALDQSLLLTPPELTQVPQTLQRPDGTSRLRPRNASRYTTRDLLDAETRLVDAGRATDGPSVAPAVAKGICALPIDGVSHPLSVEQAAAVCSVTTSGRVLDVLVGAAGTGKSTTMRAVRATWEAEHGPGSVVGLAPSAAAAEVLADAVGVPTENTAKWLTEASRQPQRRADLDALARQLNRASPSLRTRALLARARKIRNEINRWALRPRQLVIIDEASMAGTLDLDALNAQARGAGAKILLAGDWAQLSPVSAGGAFRLVAQDRDDPATLTDVHRFQNAWERAASLQLRDGKPEAADVYAARGMVVGGDRESALDLLYDAWRQDTARGKRSLMIANDAETVRDLNQRARNDRITSGDVAANGVDLADGTAAGAGDLIVTRRNARTLKSGIGWVKNGDQWRVTTVNCDGSVDVKCTFGSCTATLPAEYVNQHVELGYAMTAHRVQGRTVDTAHAFVMATTTREPLYVMATRGRESNRLYVDTTYDPDVDTAHEPAPEGDATELLRVVLATTGSDASATDTLDEEWSRARNPTRVTSERRLITRHARDHLYGEMLISAGLTADNLQALRNSTTWGSITGSLRAAEAMELDIEEGIRVVLGGLRPLADVATDLDQRLRSWVVVSMERASANSVIRSADTVEAVEHQVAKAV